MMDDACTIRLGGPQDREALITVGLAIGKGARAEGHDESIVASDKALPTRHTGHVDAILADPRHLVLIASRGGEDIGHLLGGIRPTESPDSDAEVGYIYLCYVHPSHRRRGIARRLVAAAEDWFRQRSLSRVELKWRVSNPDAEATWLGLGYAPLRVLGSKVL